MTGFMAFLKMQKITKMWECCLCHLHNHCILIVLYKDHIGQKNTNPQIQLCSFFVTRIIKLSNNFLQAAGKNNEELYKNRIIYFDDNYYPQVHKIWRLIGTRQNQPRKRDKVLHFIIITAKMSIIT